MSPDSAHFATSPAPNRVTLWRSRRQAVVGELRGPSGDVSSLAYSHDGRLLAATGDGRDTVVWNVTTHKIVAPSARPVREAMKASPSPRTSPRRNHGRRLGTTRLQPAHRPEDRGGEGRRHASGSRLQPRGELLAAAGLGEHILIWNVKERALERTIKQTALILTLRFSPDGQTIATGDLSGDVNFWDPAAAARSIARSATRTAT